ncbi:hypothetical protein [Nitrosovibrio tenuis]|uniref:Uncharacterized protein n=1 Tax=Nitrosovibrio tenuis TaxID=1233 RepID=A0A1H7KMG2_9PROT|nr:hypothetical protein [Nitrosovibrio tenuis]SEK87137.1 hypothetical protein SAMN05216387_103256 [Nitrosovibrio tenuis]
MKKNSEAMRCHKSYLRAKTALRDQHQDYYALMLERHAQELDALWGDYNLAVKKLAEEHNKIIKSRIVPIKKRVKKALSEKAEEKNYPQKDASVRSKILPMKKRVKREVTMEEENRREEEDLRKADSSIIDDEPIKTAKLPSFLSFMRF